jgi:hypothetical protein
MKECPMLLKASTIKGYAIAARDGRIGVVSDLLFDDATWLVRWCVIDTGSWLSSRKVLLPPSALGHLNADTKEFSVRLTKQEVKDSPDIDTDKPVSRQMENGIYDYFGWSPYWGTGFYMGGYGFMPPPIAESASPGCWERDDGLASGGDPHLRSATAITGYHIHARDGEIGHVEDLLVADGDWSIRYLIVDTKNWWPGKNVLISPILAIEIDWMDQLVNLDASRQSIKDAPAYDASTMVDRAYERKYHGHYANERPRHGSKQNSAAEVTDQMIRRS